MIKVDNVQTTGCFPAVRRQGNCVTIKLLVIVTGFEHITVGKEK